MNLFCHRPRSRPPQLRVRAEFNEHVVKTIYQSLDLLTAGFPGGSPMSDIPGFLPWAGHSPLQVFGLFRCRMLSMGSSKFELP